MANDSLVGVSKGEAVKKAKSWRDRFMRVKSKIAESGQNILEFAVGIGAAAGVGYLLGKIETKQLGGIDLELIIGGGLAIVGLFGLGGATMSGAARAAGTTVLGAWAFNAARAKAEGA